MDAFGARLRLAPEVLNQLMSSEDPPRPPARPQTSGGKRKTVVQKIINLALHYPRAVAQLTELDGLATLNQPGTDVLRRVLTAAAQINDATTARVLENLRGDPDYQFLERIVAEPPLGIEDEGAAINELKASLEHLGKDAVRTANALRIRGHRPGVPTE
jgi:hypothetical protein